MRENVGEGGGGAAGSPLRGLLAAIVGVSAVVAAWLLWRSVAAGEALADRWALLAGVVLAAIGLLAVLLWLGGWLEFGKLSRQRRFYEGMLDACGDAILLTDRAGRPLHANAPYRQLLRRAGYQRLIGIDHLLAGRGEAAERVYRLSLRARDGEAAVDEFRMPALAPAAPGEGGEDREGGEGDAGRDTPAFTWLRIEAIPLADDRVLWRIADTTAEHRRHDEAWRDLQRMVDYLDNMPAGLFSTAADGRITYLNATLAEWLGIELDTALREGLRLADLVPAELAERLVAIRPLPGGTVRETFLAELVDGAGKSFPVQVIHRADYDSDGTPRPSRTLVLDLRGEPARRLAEPLRLARFINAAPVGIATASPSGELTMLNAALAQITTRARLRGDVADIVPEEDREKFMAAFRTVAEGRQTQAQVDVRIDSGTDTRAQITIAATANDEDGAVATVTLYVIDTTLHQALMQELEQGQKMQAVGKLVSGIAHDFNNMLTAILGNAEMLLQRHRPEDPSFDEIMNIKNNANRAAHMVRQLLAFSRKQTLQPEVLSLTDVLSDMVSMLRRMIGEKVNLSLEHGRDLWPVRADASQLDQVIMNLAVNARDAMPDGGDLSIRTRNVPAEEAARIAPDIMPPADYVLIEVEDTGTGIPPEVLDKIYDPFFTTKAVGKGTGLGLSTVYGIVKQTGGYIFCESEQGRGTIFRIYLPRHVETEEERARRLEQRRQEDELPREDLTGSGTVLLVEDEAAVRQLAVAALRQRGYDVLEAPSAEVALDMAEEMLERGQLPDIVVSDVVMPGMDGPTMMKEMRRLGITAPFIFMSGHAEDAFAASLDEDAEFTFLAKPFTLKKIAEAVKKTLARETAGAA